MEAALPAGMTVVRSFRELWAWQTADAFKAQVFGLVRGSPAATANFRFRDQLREAARSVPVNIAEGFLRDSPGEFIRFLNYAVASLGEAELHLRDGISLEYFEEESCSPAFRLARRCATATVRLKLSQEEYLRRGGPEKGGRHSRRRKPK